MKQFSHENFHSLVESLLPFVKKHKLPVVIGSIGLMFFIYGLIALLGSSGNDQAITFEAATANDDSNEKSVKIFVDISGAVVRPSVYELPVNARMQDALVAAGGLSEDADREWVAKTINLAAKITDGTKIYIRSTNDTSNATVAQSRNQETVLGSQADGLVNINTASATTLDTLPGVGAVTAQKIIDNRPYSTVDELLSKKAVNKATFEKIKDKITIY